LLRFPLTVEKGESPDFLLTDGNSVNWGLEVTQATTQAHQRELTETEGDGSSTVRPLGRDGWAGNSAEREACASILRAMRRKARKLRSGKYRPAARYDVLIYVSTRASFYGADETVRLLMERISKWQSQWAGMGRVEVITGLYLYQIVTGTVTRLPLYDYGTTQDQMPPQGTN
jgi:hypothetical protein